MLLFITGIFFLLAAAGSWAIVLSDRSFYDAIAQDGLVTFSRNSIDLLINEPHWLAAAPFIAVPLVVAHVGPLIGALLVVAGVISFRRRPREILLQKSTTFDSSARLDGPTSQEIAGHPLIKENSSERKELTSNGQNSERGQEARKTISLRDFVGAWQGAFWASIKHAAITFRLFGAKIILLSTKIPFGKKLSGAAATEVNQDKPLSAKKEEEPGNYTEKSEGVSTTSVVEEDNRPLPEKIMAWYAAWVTVKAGQRPPKMLEEARTLYEGLDLKTRLEMTNFGLRGATALSVLEGAAKMASGAPLLGEDDGEQISQVWPIVDNDQTKEFLREVGAVDTNEQIMLDQENNEGPAGNSEAKVSQDDSHSPSVVNNTGPILIEDDIGLIIPENLKLRYSSHSVEQDSQKDEGADISTGLDEVELMPAPGTLEVLDQETSSPSHSGNEETLSSPSLEEEPHPLGQKFVFGENHKSTHGGAELANWEDSALEQKHDMLYQGQNTDVSSEEGENSIVPKELEIAPLDKDSSLKKITGRAQYEPEPSLVNEFSDANYVSHSRGGEAKINSPAVEKPFEQVLTQYEEFQQVPSAQKDKEWADENFLEKEKKSVCLDKQTDAVGVGLDGGKQEDLLAQREKPKHDSTSDGEEDEWPSADAHIRQQESVIKNLLSDPSKRATVLGEKEGSPAWILRHLELYGLLGLSDKTNPAVVRLWAALDDLVAYQARVFAWERLEEVPPEDFATPELRAEHVLNLARVVATEKERVPEKLLEEIRRIKAGTEHIAWIDRVDNILAAVSSAKVLAKIHDFIPKAEPEKAEKGGKLLKVMAGQKVEETNRIIEPPYEDLLAASHEIHQRYKEICKSLEIPIYRSLSVKIKDSDGRMTYAQIELVVGDVATPKSSTSLKEGAIGIIFVLVPQGVWRIAGSDGRIAPDRLVIEGVGDNESTLIRVRDRSLEVFRRWVETRNMIPYCVVHLLCEEGAIVDGIDKSYFGIEFVRNPWGLKDFEILKKNRLKRSG